MVRLTLLLFLSGQNVDGARAARRASVFEAAIDYFPGTKRRPLGILHNSSVEKSMKYNTSVAQRMTYSNSSIDKNLKYHNLGEEAFTFPHRKPRIFNILLATVKTWAADAVVQNLERKPGAVWKFDWQRSFVFATFGFLYVGLIQWVLYVSVLTWLFPDATVFANAPLWFKLKDRTGQFELVGQLLIDNFIFGTLIYFPVFYVVKEIIQCKCCLSSAVHGGLGKYWQNIVPDNLANITLWMPADVFIFAVPMFLRMPLDHFVSFGWTMFMSAMRGPSDRSDAKSEKTLGIKCFI